MKLNIFLFYFRTKQINKTRELRKLLAIFFIEVDILCHTCHVRVRCEIDHIIPNQYIYIYIFLKLSISNLDRILKFDFVK